ncbi:MAG TPA: hypothetical protein VJ623_13885 [Holophagaceae bacterium]|nr:hypothetical protein [Holophagaceae bacterium]
MNKTLIGALAAGLVLVGGGLLLARRGTAMAAQEEEAPLFRSQVQGAGRLMVLEAREPLRAVRWLPPLTGGWALCQVSTQADRQLLGLFQDGAFVRTISLPRPEGLSDGFFRQAEVREAKLAQGTLLLLLSPEGSRREGSFLMALGLDGALKWARRASAEHVACEGSNLWIWGPTSAQKLSFEGKGDAPDAIAFPPEVDAPQVLLPTAKGFILTHTKGLSAWQGPAGWTHTAAPAPSPLGFPDARGLIVRSGQALFWQPEPGTLLKVTPEAGVIGPAEIPAPADPLEAPLLKLLGADDSGRLWFALARPSLPQASSVAPPPLAPPAEGAEAPPVPGAAAAGPLLSGEQRTAYESRLKGPMDRLYTWNPGAGELRSFTWSQTWPRLGAPADLPIPTGDGGLRPEGRGWLAGEDARRWWLPLTALP